MRQNPFVRSVARRVRRWLRRPNSTRLHLACGTDYWPGWDNSDLAPDANADRLLDMRDVLRFYGPAFADEIVIIHGIGYLYDWEVPTFFADLLRTMQPGARLTLEFNDLDRMCRHYLSVLDDLNMLQEAKRGFTCMGDDYVARRVRYHPAVSVWSAREIARALDTAGFAEIRVLDPQCHGPRPWRDARIEATAG
jgi:hypothetical protein